MKRTDITSLFPEATDEQVSALMSINGSDINNAKRGVEELQVALEDAQTQLKDAQVNSDNLKAAIDKAKREGADPAKVHFVENEVLFPLEHQRQYLQSLLAVNQQAALSLSILRETNVALINNVRIITLATKHSVGIAKTLRSFSAGGGASPVGTPSSTPGMAALEASIDDLFAAFERHDLWHAEVAAKTQEAVGELQDLTEKVFDGTPHGYHHR